MYLCTYVRMYVCTYGTYVPMYLCTYALACLLTHTPPYVLPYVPTYALTCVLTYVLTCVLTHALMHLSSIYKLPDDALAWTLLSSDFCEGWENNFHIHTDFHTFFSELLGLVLEFLFTPSFTPTPSCGI